MGSRRKRTTAKVSLTPRDLFAARVLHALLEYSVAEIGETATENAMLRALDLPEKLPNEPHAAWRARTGV